MVMKPISRLKWIVSERDDSEIHLAQGWGYKVTVTDNEGQYLYWFVESKKTDEILAAGFYPGDIDDDWDHQFDVCEDIATLRAWRFAKKGIISRSQLSQKEHQYEQRSGC